MALGLDKLKQRAAAAKIEPFPRELVMFYKQLIDKIVAKLLMDDVMQPFGLSTLNYEIDITTMIPSPALTTFDKIYINPRDPTLQNQGTAEKSLTWTLLHEILHILLRHDTRIGLRNKEIFDLSCDYVVNAILKKMDEEKLNRVIQLNAADLTNFLYHESFEGMLEEEIYEWFMKNRKYKKTSRKMSMKDFQSQNVIGSGDGSQQSQQGPDGDQEIEIITIEIQDPSGKTITRHTVIFPEKSEDQKTDKEKEKDNSRRENTEYVRTKLANTLQKGNISNNFRQFLGRLFDTKVDWSVILKDSIQTTLEPDVELSWGKPRTIWIASWQDLPYLPNKDMIEKYGTIIFMVDESGSMCDDDIRKAASVIVQSKQYYKKIVVIKHDVDIGWVLETEELTDDIIEELLVRRKSGGTSHEPSFKFIVEYAEKNPDDPISCIIGVTDLASDIEQCQEILPYYLPRIWITSARQYHPEILGRIVQVN